MDAEFTLKVRRFESADPRLGRHVVHDSRSLRFRAPARDPRKLASVRHEIRIPIMDQGDVGSCTGHAGTNVLGSQAFWTVAQAPLLAAGDPHMYAVGLYGDATALDPWPGQYIPEDTGSDGLSVAKVLHARGLISGYQHATSLDAALSAVAERVVMVGTTWLAGMYDPAPDGHMNISGPSAGGHEYVLDELDVDRKRVWMRNSWGDGWGQGGRAWMTWDELGRLLADDGDCTILIPRTEPPPQPKPVPPRTQTSEERALAEAVTRWQHTSAGPSYLRKAATTWLQSLTKE